MKIMFVQLNYDLYGGVETVNDTLAKQFVKDGNEVKVMCFLRTGNNELISNITYQKTFIANEIKRESYKLLIKYICKFKIKKVILGIKKCLLYYINMNLYHKKLTKEIKKYDADNIIVSNPLLIKYVPHNMYNRTFVHIHSGIKEYKMNKTFLKVLLKYKNKVNKYVLLTSEAEKEFNKLGFKNTCYINNPLRIKSNKVSNLNNKKIIYIGRIAKEKRVNLLIEIFKISHLFSKGWTLNIYGSGKINLDKCEGVRYLGPTNDVETVLRESDILALTSEYEGFPMVVLEANELGVPVISFDFGNDLIINRKTGIVVENSNKEKYVQELIELCNNPEILKKMAKNAKKNVVKYYPLKIARDWYKLFKEGDYEN